jgi:anti-sigma B factor antagonist
MATATVATVRKLQHACVVEVKGDVTSFSEQAFKDAWGEASATGARRIIFDLEKVQYMNSAGIAILIDLVAEAQKSQCQIALVWQSEHFRKILKMVGLTRFVTIHSSLDEAVSAA